MNGFDDWWASWGDQVPFWTIFGGLGLVVLVRWLCGG